MFNSSFQGNPGKILSLAWVPSTPPTLAESPSCGTACRTLPPMETTRQQLHQTPHTSTTCRLLFSPRERSVVSPSPRTPLRDVSEPSASRLLTTPHMNKASDNHVKTELGRDTRDLKRAAEADRALCVALSLRSTSMPHSSINMHVYQTGPTLEPHIHKVQGFSLLWQAF